MGSHRGLLTALGGLVRGRMSDLWFYPALPRRAVAKRRW